MIDATYELVGLTQTVRIKILKKLDKNELRLGGGLAMGYANYYCNLMTR